MDLVSTKPKPALDEKLFQDLLEAAHVVQQHNDAVRDPAPATAAIAGSSKLPSAETSELPDQNAEAAPSSCRVCGRPFGPDDVFCGNCSMPRSAGMPSEDLQSKWASLWYMRQAQESAQSKPSQSPDRSSPQTPSSLQVHEIPPATAIIPLPSSSAGGPGVGTPGALLWQNSPPTRVPEAGHDGSANPPREVAASESLNRTSPAAPSDNPSAMLDAKPEIAAVSQSDLPQHTGHAVRLRVPGRYLTWALRATGLLVLLVILAAWPSPKNPQLTLFQSLLVKLGLADVPASPIVVKSNPDAKVWVDVHTALYYCEGSDLYGTTPDGHFATQRDAQQDEFEPAERVPCP